MCRKGKQKILSIVDPEVSRQRRILILFVHHLYTLGLQTEMAFKEI